MTTATTQRSALLAAIEQYAARLHATAGNTHHVASPLGAWTLLALCATATTGAERAEFEQYLGTDVDTAARFSAELLAKPHPAIAAAAAAWVRSARATDGLRMWLAAMPRVVPTGEMPDPSALDGWALEKSLGLIPKFPSEVGPETILLLATALATKVKWIEPFRVVPGDRLGLCAFGGGFTFGAAILEVTRSAVAERTRRLAA